MKKIISLLLIGLLASTAAAAGSPIHQIHALTPDARVSISNVKGEVRVRAWDRNEIEITGILGKGARRLAVEGSNSDLTVKVEGPGKSGWFNWGSDSQMEPSTLHIKVPAGINLEVDVVSADVDVAGLNGGRISADTVSGGVIMQIDTPELKIDSVSGDVELSGRADDVDIETVSGDIAAPEVRRKASLQTVSGNMHLRGGPFSRVGASTVSGDIDIQGGPGTAGSVHVESMSGDVRLALPASTSATCSAETFSGSLHSDFGKVSEARHGPGSSLKATLGQGEAEINIETFSGDVRIRRQN